MSAISPKNDLEDLSKRLGYTFKQPELLTEAFRHSSYVNELSDSELRDNERLEFLGDAVLDLAISDILMELFHDSKEGDLSKYRATVVNEAGLCQVAQELELGEYLMLGRGEEMSRGREKPSILANTMEALLGALYLDVGFDKTKEIVHELFSPLLARIDTGRVPNDYKSQLQEYTQGVYKTRPEYVLLEESGPAHDKTFRVALRLDGKVVAEAKGKSKKEAEQKAAKEALPCLTGEREKEF
jgi:ribonuclease III